MEGDRKYLERMLIVLQQAKEFSESGFEDIVTKRAVERSIGIIGETAGKVSSKFRKKNPNMPWRKIEEMRSELLHNYYLIDEKILSEMVNDNLPVIEKQLIAILEK